MRMMIRVELDTVSGQKRQSYVGLAVGNSLNALRSTTDIGLWTYGLNFQAQFEGDEIVEQYRGGRRPS